MKTPEEMALEYAEDWHKDCDYPAEILRHTKKATETVFLAGYQAAKDEDKAKLQNLEANWKFCCEDKNRLIKELAATERALDKVTDADKVMPQWISVKERLPETGKVVLAAMPKGTVTLGGIRKKTQAWDVFLDMAICTAEPTHWMPLPEPPRKTK